MSGRMYAGLSRQSVQHRSTTAVQQLRQDFTELVTGGCSPHLVAASFAVGMFITVLPTMGLGLVVFLVLLRTTDWVNEVALFSTLVVVNPVTKLGIYYGSYRIGEFLFGPADPTVAAGTGIVFLITDLVKRLVIGNVIIALLLALGSYGVVRLITAWYQRRHLARITV